jgi:RNA polymerase sigma factor (sigma-70 family)
MNVPFRRVLLLVALATSACAPPAARPLPAPATPLASFELVMLGTTDVHGRLLPVDYYTGEDRNESLARLKPLVDSVRAAHPGRALLFDSGDLLQGNPIGYLYGRIRTDEPNPIIDAMNLLAYDAAAIGNHEFNYGLAHLDRAIAQARFPFVSANIFRHGTRQHAYTPYVLLRRPTGFGDSITIGVTGNTPPGVHVWDRENVEGVLEFRDVVASLAEVVPEMRRRGADVVVVLSHGGFEGTSYDREATGLPPENDAARVAREVPGVDVIFLGHSHRELADSTITSAANPDGVLFTQGRNWARSLGVATLNMARTQDGAWRVASKRGSLLHPRPTLADTAFIEALRWPHERTIEYVNTRIGRTEERWDASRARVEPSAVVGFINEVMRRRAGAQLAATAAFNIDASLPAGDITVAHLARLYPYDNTLKAVRITGAELRAFLEKSAEYYRGWPAAGGATVTNFEVPGYNFDIVSGVDYTLDVSRPLGERVTRLEYQGGPGAWLHDLIGDHSATDPESAAEMAEVRARLVRAIEGLSEQERVVTTFYYYEGLTLKEIGRILSLTEGRISQILHSALVRLRQHLAEESRLSERT